MVFFLYFILIVLCLFILWYLFYSTRELIRLVIPICGWGGFYVPTRPEAVELMVHLAQINSSDVVADFGSGDGRLLIAAAKAGAKKISWIRNPTVAHKTFQKIDCKRKIRKQN